MKLTYKISAIVIALVITAFSVVSSLGVNPQMGTETEEYIAAAECSIPAFAYDDNEELQKVADLTRGTKVWRITSPFKADPEGMARIEAGDEEYYIDEKNLTDSKEDIVREKTVYVRTPATVYANAKGPEIAGLVKKGRELSVIGYDKLNKDGTVNKYQIDLGDDKSGYVYGKYMVFSQEEADENYNESGAYTMAKKAKYPFDLHGGKATNLDYFPHEKPQLEGNEFCDKARAVYLHAGAVTSDKYFDLVKESGANAVVLNIDGGGLAYESEVAKELSPTAYKNAKYSVEKYQKAVKRYNDAGIYTIGRIVCFNDEKYAKDNPKACIKYNGHNTRWVSAYSRDVWYYKVSLAMEAVQLMGFNEIQFDYVRFPEASYEYSTSGSADFRNRYDEEKAQAIQNFCFYAADQIHEAGAYFSVDVFGEASNGYVTAYGQYWPAISNVVDAISSMPYTDHHGDHDTWSDPYPTLHKWAKWSADMQAKIPTPAAARTWITGYNTPYWNPTVSYDYNKMKAQVDALEDAGLDGGWIPWNSSSDYNKYKQIKKIWSYGK